VSERSLSAARYGWKRTPRSYNGAWEAGFVPSGQSRHGTEGLALPCQSCGCQAGHGHGAKGTLGGAAEAPLGEETQSAPANLAPQPPPFPSVVPDLLFWGPAPVCKGK